MSKATELKQNAKQSIAWYSTWFFGALAALPILWAEVPQEVKDIIPVDWQPYILAAVAVAGYIARIVPQRSA